VIARNVRLRDGLGTGIGALGGRVASRPYPLAADKAPANAVR